MITPETIAFIAAALIILKWAGELALVLLNQRWVTAHPTPPPGYEHVEPETFQKARAYTLAKGRLNLWQDSYETVVLLLALFSGLLPWLYAEHIEALGQSVWSLSLFLIAVMTALSLLSLPFDWHAQFRLEERFGFNTQTTKGWIIDKIKGLIIALVLFLPLLALLLKLVTLTGSTWWIWAWAVLFGFQLLMVALAPKIIMPLFNKFTPLPDGPLRDRLLELAHRLDFTAQTIQIMDGSRRSRHSNAFFTGFGSFRKIVLFDTLVDQLNEHELEAVLAHEIGHYKKGHIPKLIAVSALSLGIGFFILSLLAQSPQFYQAFGFEPGNIAPAFLLFGLLSGAVTFWFSPLFNLWSRKNEFEADRFAAQAVEQKESLESALEKLNEKNLSNPNPHPLYSAVYYSHPTLAERKQALATAELREAGAS